jgi:hypothetical protein
MYVNKGQELFLIVHQGKVIGDSYRFFSDAWLDACLLDLPSFFRIKDSNGNTWTFNPRASN